MLRRTEEVGEVVEIGLSAIEGKETPFDKEYSTCFQSEFIKSFHSSSIRVGTSKAFVIVSNFNEPLKFITLYTPNNVIQSLILNSS